MATSGRVKCKCGQYIEYQFNASADKLKGETRTGTFVDRNGKVDLVCTCRNVVAEILIKSR